MYAEANEVLSHFGLVNRAVSILRRRGIEVVTELKLPNGRIADIAYLGAADRLHIIEAKIDFRPGHLTEARYRYGQFCDFLWIAVPINYELPPAVTMPGARWSSPDDMTGICKVDREGLGYVRHASHRHPPALALADARSALRRHLTAGEQAPSLLAGHAAERPNNNNAGHEGRRCEV